MKIRRLIKLAWWWIWDFLFVAYLDYFYSFFKGARPNIQLDRLCLEKGIPVLVKMMRYVNRRERHAK